MYLKTFLRFSFVILRFPPVEIINPIDKVGKWQQHLAFRFQINLILVASKIQINHEQINHFRLRKSILIYKKLHHRCFGFSNWASLQSGLTSTSWACPYMRSLRKPKRLRKLLYTPRWECSKHRFWHLEYQVKRNYERRSGSEVMLSSRKSDA